VKEMYILKEKGSKVGKMAGVQKNTKKPAEKARRRFKKEYNQLTVEIALEQLMQDKHEKDGNRKQIVVNTLVFSRVSVLGSRPSITFIFHVFGI